MKSCPPPSIVQLLSLKKIWYLWIHFDSCVHDINIWAWNRCIGTAVTHDNTQRCKWHNHNIMQSTEGWSYWWQGIMLFHDKSNLPLHFTVVYPVTLFILQSLPFFGRFLVIPLLCQLQWIMATKWQFVTLMIMHGNGRVVKTRKVLFIMRITSDGLGEHRRKEGRKGPDFTS